MRKHIIYFVGFLALAAVNSWIDHAQEGVWNFQENIFKALFIALFIRGGFWFEKRVYRKEAQEKGEAGN
ncbi:hypothetical protein [Planococcus plakortidis]|uniref:hypothetical protein n=1 Tax=Planococcus plakortidis TaxID=1038856 RepID=UPI003984D29B